MNQTEQPPACSECSRPAVARDGRHLCLKHLKKAIARDTPMVGCYVGKNRGRDHREAPGHDPSPWQENVIRELEDG